MNSSRLVALGQQLGLAGNLQRFPGDAAHVATGQQQADVLQPRLVRRGEAAGDAAQADAENAELVGIVLCRVTASQAVARRMSRTACVIPATVARGSGLTIRRGEFGIAPRAIVRHLHEQRVDAVPRQRVAKQSRQRKIAAQDVQHDHRRPRARPRAV